MLIRVERVLDLDSEGQLVASILSKKIAAGSTHLVLDLPVGPTAKVRSHEAADGAGAQPDRCRPRLRPARSAPCNRTAPSRSGRGIGPALEARDVLACCRATPTRRRICATMRWLLAGTLLEMGGGGARRRRPCAGRAHPCERPRLGQVPGHLRGAGRHAHAARGAPSPCDDRRPHRHHRPHRQPPAGQSRQAGRRARRQGRRRRNPCAHRPSHRRRRADLHDPFRGAGRTGLCAQLRARQSRHCGDRDRHERDPVRPARQRGDDGKAGRGAGRRCRPAGGAPLSRRGSPSALCRARWPARRVVLVSTLDRPDAKFLPLAFAAATARELGALDVGAGRALSRLYAPGPPFRDRRGGHARRSSRRLVSQSFDWLVTVDPHLHRIKRLEQIYAIPARAQHAAALISDWIADNVPDAVLIGPDAESAQWVERRRQGRRQALRRADQDPPRRPRCRGFGPRCRALARPHAGAGRRHHLDRPHHDRNAGPSRAAAA